MNLNLDDFDFGFTSHSEEDVKVLLGADPNAKAQALYNAIIPLLDNLAKDADKSPHIHWPNRSERIYEFKVKLLGILEN